MPPCMLHYVTGLPCPFCGMTTAFAHMARWHVREAFDCHVLGPAFFCLAWVVLVASARGLVLGRWPLPDWAMSSRFHWVLLGAIGVAWAVNVARVLE